MVAAGTGGPKLPLHQRAAQKLRTLSWLMLQICASAEGQTSLSPTSHSELQGSPVLGDSTGNIMDLEPLQIDPNQVEVLVLTVLRGLHSNDPAGVRDLKALLQALNALKVCFAYQSWTWYSDQALGST